MKSYAIDVCTVCEERVLAEGYACNRLCSGAGTKVIVVVPVARFDRYRSGLERIAAAAEIPFDPKPDVLELGEMARGALEVADAA